MILTLLLFSNGGLIFIKACAGNDRWPSRRNDTQVYASHSRVKLKIKRNPLARGGLNRFLINDKNMRCASSFVCDQESKKTHYNNYRYIIYYDVYYLHACATYILRKRCGNCDLQSWASQTNKWYMCKVWFFFGEPGDNKKI